MNVLKYSIEIEKNSDKTDSAKISKNIKELRNAANQLRKNEVKNNEFLPFLKEDKDVKALRESFWNLEKIAKDEGYEQIFESEEYKERFQQLLLKVKLKDLAIATQLFYSKELVKLFAKQFVNLSATNLIENRNELRAQLPATEKEFEN